MKNLPAVLGDVQRRFVQELMETADVMEAAKRSKITKAEAIEITKNPLIMREIRRDTLARMHAEALPKAYRLLDDMLTKSQPSKLQISEPESKNYSQGYTPPRSGVDLVKFVFERTGVGVAKESEQPRDLSEMSLDELYAVVRRLEAERSAAAKPVDAQQVPANPDKPLDFME